ncbi:MAG: hypothetical protein COV47_02665 [Candidatus Diapherotrites archaeon CG11_big_fil_rev_8_21_14_0_20_37_9]|nr:MAG: hypothetical protein COV47_02665 [Candidatus Diapherotrites archaeon CG11_big_fil_rev_8_21_14_0_20_37_9]
MITRIKKLGLNEYESRAYHSLLKYGSMAPVAVSKAAGIPRARVYDVLQSLEDKGFAVKMPFKQVVFSAITPKDAFDALSAKRKSALDKELDGIKGVVSELESKLSVNEDFIGESALLVKGRENIYAQIAREASNCADGVIIYSSDEGIKRKKSYLFGNNSVTLPSSLKLIAKATSKARAVIFDKAAMMLFLTPEKTEEKDEKALLIKSPFLANLFVTGLKK